MRVPPLFVWLLRGAVLAVIVTLAVAALTTQSPATSSAAAPAFAAPTLTVAPVAPPPTVAPLPTQTPQPITSIIVRSTLAPYPTATPLPPNWVSAVDFSFMPGVVHIKAGETVFWRNDGTEQHDVTGSDWHSGALDPGYTYHLTFGIPGTYPYRCSIHLDMVGSVIVT
jgi:hypothetical protein